MSQRGKALFAVNFRSAQGPVERRGNIREPSDQGAHIAFHNNELGCEIIDISVKGAQIRLAEPANVPNFFELHTPADEIFLCEVKHRKGAIIGLQFLMHS